MIRIRLNVLSCNYNENTWFAERFLRKSFSMTASLIIVRDLNKLSCLNIKFLRIKPMYEVVCPSFSHWCFMASNSITLHIQCFILYVDTCL